MWTSSGGKNNHGAGVDGNSGSWRVNLGPPSGQELAALSKSAASCPPQPLGEGQEWSAIPALGGCCVSLGPPSGQELAALFFLKEKVPPLGLPNP